MLSAQNGGRAVFSFLGQSPSARLTGLSQSQIAIREDDLAVGYINPAMLNPLNHNGLGFNQNFLLGGINSGLVSYAYSVDRLKTTFSANIQYISYGDFKQTDEYAIEQGNFKATEYAVVLGAGRQINERFSVGANLKFIQSRLEMYNSTGLAADIAGAYIHPEKNFGATILLRNMGTQLSTYAGGDRENLPFDLQIGVSKKLARAPFRLSVLAHNLLRGLRYDNPLEEEISLLGEEVQEKSRFSKTVDELFRHLNFGGEILLGKTEILRLRAGYSHQLRREMSIQNLRSLAGFSFGVGLKIKRFRLEYGHGRQHIAGGMNHLSIATQFGKL
jgi:hypothetical protein